MTQNTSTLHDDSWSQWHRLFGKVYITDIDQLITNQASQEEVKMEFGYVNGAIDFVAIIDHKCGAGNSSKSLQWSPMQVQLELAKRLNIPMFLSIDYLLDEFPTPVSYVVGCNDLGKQFIEQCKKGAKGLWLPPYYYAKFLHQLRGKKMDDREVIDPFNKHAQVPELKKLIDQYHLVKLGDLPKALPEKPYQLPTIQF